MNLKNEYGNMWVVLPIEVSISIRIKAKWNIVLDFKKDKVLKWKIFE